MKSCYQAIKTAPTAPGLSVNALRVLEARYLRRDEQQFFARVAEAVAAAEDRVDNSSEPAYWRDEFYRMTEKPLHYDHASRCDPQECRV